MLVSSTIRLLYRYQIKQTDSQIDRQTDKHRYRLESERASECVCVREREGERERERERRKEEMSRNKFQNVIEMHNGKYQCSLAASCTHYTHQLSYPISAQEPSAHAVTSLGSVLACEAICNAWPSPPLPTCPEQHCRGGDKMIHESRSSTWDVISALREAHMCYVSPACQIFPPADAVWV